jgi:hypothetical protein
MKLQRLLERAVPVAEEVVAEDDEAMWRGVEAPGIAVGRVKGCVFGVGAQVDHAVQRLTSPVGRQLNGLRAGGVAAELESDVKVEAVGGVYGLETVGSAVRRK